MDENNEYYVKNRKKIDRNISIFNKTLVIIGGAVMLNCVTEIFPLRVSIIGLGIAFAIGMAEQHYIHSIKKKKDANTLDVNHDMQKGGK